MTSDIKKFQQENLILSAVLCNVFELNPGDVASGLEELHDMGYVLTKRPSVKDSGGYPYEEHWHSQLAELREAERKEHEVKVSADPEIGQVDREAEVDYTPNTEFDPAEEHAALTGFHETPPDEEE